MKDERKTKKQLIAELTELRQKVTALEASPAEHEHTEAHARAEARSRAEERNRALYEFSPDGILTVDLDGHIIECNRAYAEMLGYRREELEGFPFQDTMAQRWHDFCAKIYQEVMGRGYSYEFEKECIRKDGTVFPASMRIWRIDDESGSPVGVWAIARDITERKRVEEELGRYSKKLEELVEDKTRTLRKSEREKAAILDHMLELVLYQDLDMRILWANRAAGDSIGLSSEQLVGRRCFELWHQRGKPCAGCPVVQARESGQPQEAEMTTPDGRAWLVRGYPIQDVDGKIASVVEVTLDITERKHLEEQMRLQERLAAVGQLAGGIAHDFNNFLTTIMLYAQILLRKPSLPPELAPVAETILEESRRAAQLVRRLLDFSRRSLIETRPVNLSPFVEKTVDILRRTLPENIQLLVDVGLEEYVVNADPARIQQVVMNLALNARDAMPDGGELHIGLSLVEVRAGDEPPVAEMTPGEWVCLTISDTGTGMTEEVQSHLFEPFFTTKGPKGTGLGLAQVYGVVKRHDGHIRVETQMGQGTTFRVYLTPHNAAELEESPKATSAPPQGQGEIILLAEDEDRVREAGCEILESLGYRVLAATNGQKAMQVYRSAERVDLVLTDLVMPGMGGKELAQELRKIAPHVKVLAVTGYTVTEDIEELKQVGILNVVHKPFEVKTLAEIIRQTLDVD